MLSNYPKHLKIIEDHLTNEGNGVFISPEIIIDRIMGIFSDFIIKEAPNNNFYDVIFNGSYESHRAQQDINDSDLI